MSNGQAHSQPLWIVQRPKVKFLYDQDMLQDAALIAAKFRFIV